MDGWTDGRMDGRMDGWTDGWMDGQMDGWMGFIDPKLRHSCVTAARYTNMQYEYIYNSMKYKQDSILYKLEKCVKLLKF